MRRGQDYITHHLPNIHRDLNGMSRTEARVSYIRELSTPPIAHNFHFYKLRKRKYDNPGTVWLTICPKGLEIFEASLYCCSFSSAYWHNFHFYKLRKHKYDNPGTVWLAICPKGLEIFEASLYCYSFSSAYWHSKKIKLGSRAPLLTTSYETLNFSRITDMKPLISVRKHYIISLHHWLNWFSTMYWFQCCSILHMEHTHLH